MIIRLLAQIKMFFYKRKLKNAVKQAESNYKLTRFHYLVLRDDIGKVMVISRKDADILV